jgi:hypothetical protein
MPDYFRLHLLWSGRGKVGKWPIGRTKGHEDWLLHDPVNHPFIPHTGVRRAKVDWLGPNLPAVSAAEVERIPRQLAEYFADVDNRATAKINTTKINAATTTKNKSATKVPTKSNATKVHAAY